MIRLLQQRNMSLSVMAQSVGKEKREVEVAIPDPELVADVTARLDGRMKAIVASMTERDARNEAMAELREAIISEYTAADPDADIPAVYEVFESLLKKANLTGGMGLPR